MIVIPTQDFNKSVAKIKDKIALKRLDVLLARLEQAQSLSEVPNVMAISNYPLRYRIRTGDYRLMIKLTDFNEITILLIEYLKRDENTYKNYN